MRIPTFTSLAIFALVVACGERERSPEEAPPLESPDTAAAAVAPGGEGVPGGGTAASDAATTTIAGRPTTATTAAEIGAPEPPGGYAVQSDPATEGRLASIEYATPNTVAEAAQFYDTQMQSARRLELDVAGDNVVVYALRPGTKITAATTIQDVERMLDSPTEPMVIIGPWTLGRNDPLIRDLRSIGQNTQADALLQTRSKVTVVYAVP
jgi:hypothetical protein